MHQGPRFPKNTHDYRELIRSLFSTRLQRDMNNSAANALSANLQADEKERTQLSVALEEQETSYRHWLQDEFDTTLQCLNESEGEFDQSGRLNDELRKISSMIIKEKSKVLKLEQQFSDLQHCRTILRTLLPNLENKKGVLTAQPANLVALLKELELSGLQYLLYREQEHAYLDRLVKDVSVIKNTSEILASALRQEIEDLVELTMAEEERVEALQHYATDLVNHVEASLVLDPVVIALFVDVESAYKACVPEAVSDATLVEMVQGLSSVIDVLVAEVSKLPNKAVVQAELQVRHAERLALKDVEFANLALRKLGELERLFRKRKRILLRRAWRSTPPHEAACRVVVEDCITPLQREFIECFTMDDTNNLEEFQNKYPGWEEKNYLAMFP